MRHVVDVALLVAASVAAAASGSASADAILSAICVAACLLALDGHLSSAVSGPIVASLPGIALEREWVSWMGMVMLSAIVAQLQLRQIE
jgi:hypothetical protein